jgi:hypothetical protein
MARQLEFAVGASKSVRFEKKNSVRFRNSLKKALEIKKSPAGIKSEA